MTTLVSTRIKRLWRLRSSFSTTSKCCEGTSNSSPISTAHRLTWYGSPSDVSAEANDGRGPADFKIGRGAKDKTIVEMKLAKNSQLKRNLQRQIEIYKAASDAGHAIKVILFFNGEEEEKVARILAELGLSNDRDVVLIDARMDNKPSGSKA